MASKLDDMEREELYKLYIKLQECKSEIESLARRTANWPAAKAYWFASLSVAINDSEYATHNPTFRSFLMDEGVIDEDDNFIEWKEDEEYEGENPEDTEPPTKRESSHPTNQLTELSDEEKEEVRKDYLEWSGGFAPSENDLDYIAAGAYDQKYENRLAALRAFLKSW